MRSASRRLRTACGAVVLIYLILGGGSMQALRPSCDEGHFASPAFNLITRGHMGTTVLEPTATWRRLQLTGIDEYTYWIMPLYVLAQAVWYKLAGFGLLSMRAMSLVWGLVALAAWYYLMKDFTGERSVAVLTMGLLAIDFQFLWSASMGRMDMMSTALGFAGWAAYLRLRGRNFSLAVFTSQSLMAAAVFTHPVALLAFLGLLFLTLYYDQRRTAWRHVLLAAVPYVAGAAGWSMYILKNPSLFLTQFGGNASDRFEGLTAPLTALKLEITDRYLQTYGFASSTFGFSRLKIVVLLVYFFGVGACVASPGIRRQRHYRALLILTGIYFFMLPLIDSFQQPFYLVHILPMFVALFAAWIHHSWSHRTLPPPALAVVLCALVAVQLAVVGSRIKQDRYRSSYLPATSFLNQHKAGRNALVMASAEWAFELGFDGTVLDDYRLGFRSGKKPDLIVIDEEHYAEWIQGLEALDPANYRYIQQLLDTEFRLIGDGPEYKIYARRTP